MPALEKVHAYFGGTFDPPHLGHHQMLSALVELPEVACVHVVPTSVNPLKASAEAPLYSNAQRRDICKAWLSDMGDRVRLEEIELGSSEASYTLDTIGRLKQTGQKWVLVMSSDQLRGLGAWRGGQELFAKAFAELWVFSRGDGPISFDQVPLVLRQAQILIRWLPNKIQDVSSTDLRRALRGDNALRELDLSLFAPRVFAVLPVRS
jgi:nicotinate-nucleotide adenylyltransferase